MEAQERLEQLEELKRRMAEERPAPWDNLPDLPLYMDQVVSYLGRQLITFHEGERLTSAMINNYIKDGIVPRANGKRYGREHLVFLTAIAVVKQVLSVRDMSALLECGIMDGDPQDCYEQFCAGLDAALKDALADMEAGPDDLPALAVSLALHSYADALACRRILDLLRTQEPDTGKDKKKKKQQEKPV